MQTKISPCRDARSPARPALLAALATALTLAAAPRGARADRDQLLDELREFTAAVRAGNRDGTGAAGAFTRPATDCADVVRRLAASGMKPDDEIDDATTFPLRMAGDVCKDYGRWQQAIAAAQVVERAGDELTIAERLEPGEVDPALARTNAQRARDCTAAIDRAFAAGVPPLFALEMRWNGGDGTFSLAAVRTDVCEKLAAWAKAYGPATTAAKQATADAARKRYASVGAGGDRLSWLVYYDPDGTGATWFLPGCKEEGDPKKLAKAPVLLRWTTSDDGSHEIRRLQFKGNRLVKDTTRSFLTEGAARRGCK